MMNTDKASAHSIRRAGVQGGAAPLPEQLIRQPPATPFHVPISLVPHFIQASARFCILQAVLFHIRRIIIHAMGADTGNPLTVFIDIDLFGLILRRFDDDS